MKYKRIREDLLNVLNEKQFNALVELFGEIQIFIISKMARRKHIKINEIKATESAYKIYLILLNEEDDMVSDMTDEEAEEITIWLGCQSKRDIKYLVEELMKTDIDIDDLDCAMYRLYYQLEDILRLY